MNTRENISELNENLRPFPEAQDVFAKEQAWLKNHFLPLMSIDLAEINPDWAGQKVYMICPFEPYEGYIGDNTTEYHNEYTAPNWLAFRLTDDNKFEFLGKEGYFERTAIHHWDFNSEEEEAIQGMADNYEKSKANVAKYGTLVNVRYPEYKGELNKRSFLEILGGEFEYGNWSSSIERKEYPKAFEMKIQYGKDDEEVVFDISYKGNPFYLVAETGAYYWIGSGGYIIMLYEPVSRIVLFTFDY
ncbi:hypothetical protein [uncultured Campylobacter sp.]|uniref:hypothetical protein n=1 Tax=uncultured Campylobacter sp. TaxID=218934 RepID=UPI0025EC5D8A|nr:hypothetical protein [uncultured Campylobacter sp.]